MRSPFPGSTLLGCLTAAMLVGCGSSDQPPLGRVSGRVTLDGKPLEGAIIVAMPEVGRPGTANIGADGRYELQYTEGVGGTKLGRTRISFVWPTDVSGPEIPAKYGEKSELAVEVKKGDNTFDFALESDAGENSPVRASSPAKFPAKTKKVPLD